MLISDSAREQNQSLHEAGNFGTVGEQYAPLVAEIITRLEIKHLLDYGCGSRLSLASGLKGRSDTPSSIRHTTPVCLSSHRPPSRHRWWLA